MGRFGLGAGLAIAALAISGCGTMSSPDATATVSVTASTPRSVSSTAPTRVHGGGPQSVESPDGSQTPPSPVFPLTISRTGGIAEFKDVVTLRADGHVNVETRSVHSRTCTLDRQSQRDLIAAIGTLSLGGTGATGTPDPLADGSAGIGTTGETVGGSAGNDTSRIVISVVDARGRPVNLSEPSLASVLTMVTSLVSDVTLSQPLTRCTTAPAAPAGS